MGNIVITVVAAYICTCQIPSHRQSKSELTPNKR
jgi:hypothetical protein